MALSSTCKLLLHTTDEWNAYKPIIEEHYMIYGRSLKDVMAIMKDDYGFEASVKAYKRRFEMWQWEKKVTRSRFARSLAARVAINLSEQSDGTRLVGTSSISRIVSHANIEKYREKNKIDLEHFIQTQALWNLKHSPKRSAVAVSSGPRLFIPAHQRASESVVFHAGEHMCQRMLALELLENHYPPQSFSNQETNQEVLLNSASIISSCAKRGEIESALLYYKKALDAVVNLIEHSETEMISVIIAFIEILWSRRLQQLARTFCVQIARIAGKRYPTDKSLCRALSALPSADLSQVRYLHVSIEENYLALLGIDLDSHRWKYEEQVLTPLTLKWEKDLIDDSEVLKVVSRLDAEYGPANWKSIYLLTRLGQGYHCRRKIQDAQVFFTNVVDRTRGVSSLDVETLVQVLDCKLCLGGYMIISNNIQDGMSIMEECLAGFQYLETNYDDHLISGRVLDIINFLIEVAISIGDIDKAERLYDQKIEVLRRNSTTGDFPDSPDTFEAISFAGTA